MWDAFSTKSPDQVAKNCPNGCGETLERDQVQVLPDDVARCCGVGSEGEGWRDGCEVCLRRLATGGGDYVVHMEPPPIIAFQCEFLIEA
jgi:hypothetical protein